MPLEYQEGRRQFVKFSFFQIATEWRRLDPMVQDQQIEELVAVVGRWSDRNMVRTYSTVGTRADTHFMIWQVSYELSDIHAMATELLGCDISAWLEQPHSYLSMTKHSQYVERPQGPSGVRSTRLVVAPGEHKYLFVYPLTKLREWYSLSKDERQEAMNQHLAIGATYPEIKINTTYSFGLDDPEFVLAFEGDDPATFLDLVQELRPSMSSAYTKDDVPIFTCIAVDARTMLEAARGRKAAVSAG
jgi:chlorite dismutase